MAKRYSTETLTANLEKYLVKKSRDLNLGVQDVVAQECGLLTAECYRKTPPNGKNEEASGYRNIQTDIGRACTLLTEERFSGYKETSAVEAKLGATAPAKSKPEGLKDRIVDAIRTKNYSVMQTLLRVIWKGAWEVKPFASDMHTSVRNIRGRVSSQQLKATMDEEAYNTYKGQIDSHLGWGKHGWLPAIGKLPQQKSAGKSSVLPSYVTRHGSGGGGVSITSSGTQSSVRVWNSSIKAPGMQRVVDAALKNRTVSIKRNLFLAARGFSDQARAESKQIKSPD